MLYPLCDSGLSQVPYADTRTLVISPLWVKRELVTGLEEEK